MNVVRFIKSKMCTHRRACITDNGRDLMLYRQLRRAESKLHETRECLQQKLASQHTCLDECAPFIHEQFQQQIELLQRELTQLEADYQHAQKNVREYFYLGVYPGRLPESELTAGHPAQ